MYKERITQIGELLGEQDKLKIEAIRLEWRMKLERREYIEALAQNLAAPVNNWNTR